MIAYANHDRTRAPHPVILTIPPAVYDEPYGCDAFTRLITTLPEVVERYAAEPKDDGRKRNFTDAARAKMCSRARERQERLLSSILDMLKTGSLTGCEIAGKVGYTRLGICRPLRVLRDQGLIRNTGFRKSSKWRLCNAD